MKTLNYFILAFAIIITSCTSNEGLETAIDDNLPAIAQKLKALETSLILDNDLNTAEKLSPKKRKSLRKSQESCQHEYTTEENYNGESLKISYKFFDKNGNPTTDCELEDIEEFPISYAIETEILMKTPNLEFFMHQYTRNEASFSIKGNTGSYKQNVDSMIDGYIDSNGNVFNFLDGSYLKSSVEFTGSQNSDFEDLFENAEQELELKFIIGFDANSADYHFEMIMDSEDLENIENSQSSDFTVDYNLLNSSNQKIGVIKYSLLSNGEESFTLYDLEGIIVE
jgi:hypothetical protein